MRPKAKKALKKAKQNKEAIKNIPAGEKGDTGDTGATGDTATNLFAYVLDDGDLEYNEGATAAVKDSTGHYTVTFNQSLVNCVAVGNAGIGNPPGGGSVTFSATVTVLLSSGNANQLEVLIAETDGDAAFEDNNFLIAVFC